MKIKFRKMHGLGNDFVIVDLTENPLALTQKQLALLGDRHYGVGCDQIMIIERAKSGDVDIALRIYNADGSEIEACGNGTRCAAHLWMTKNRRESCVVQTLGGFLECRISGDNQVTVNMGTPKTGWRDIPLAEDCDPASLSFPGKITVKGMGLSIGNPHIVFFIDNIESLDLEAVGPLIETDPIFPQKANVEFAQVLAADKIRMRVWERGAGVTQACGSGACATVVAAVLQGKSARKAKVILDGGALEIDWQEDSGHILMTGPVAYVFKGEIAL